MFSHEEYLALRNAAGILDRSGRGRLRLIGPDRRSYLQGLLTNDVQALTPGTGCYAALLTAQGRMISDMRVLETGEEIFMDLEADVTPRVRDHLSQFIFSEDVDVEDARASTSQYGLYGPAAAPVLAKMFASHANGNVTTPSASELEEMPMFANARWPVAGVPVLIVRSDDAGVAGFDLFIASNHAASLLSLLAAAGAVHVGAEAAEVCRIEAGRPLFGVDMDEDTIPLEAGIEDRAISLTKGCYVGQEIIIRVLHRGHGRVARRLVGLTFDASADPPARGAAVNSGTRDIGRVTSSAHSPALGHPIALGYVHRDFTQPGTVVSVVGSAATVVQTPFVR
jgi:folate-binding protein YgfZ